MTHPGPLFSTFFGGGFECSTHRRAHDRRRVDVIAASSHDTFARTDYAALAENGLGWSRDGLRWHLAEPAPGRYDWSSFLPLHRAARDAGVTAVWDLCHYGIPDGLDLWTPAFVDRFAAFARAAALVVREESDDVPWWCPINEISFWSFAGGDAAFLPPFAHGRGFELKVQLARAAIAASHAVRDVDPRARLMWADPMIHVARDPNRPDLDVEGQRLAMFQGWDLIAGRLWPQVGGDESLLDVVGVNYYPNNQWIGGGGPHLAPGDALYRPLREMLVEVGARYGRPVVLAETGTEWIHRAPWMASVGAEVRAARRAGADVRGVCWYPIANHPGWDDERHCPNGLFGYPDETGERPVDAPLAAEMARQARLVAAPRRRASQLAF
ncbi:MAG TPA: hypothetical protein VGB53_13345 [Rubricoccaceae bacterium]|jgi:hypothetical protein